ncbi:histone H3-like centromeric protein A [Apis laboriosa]|uniref:histone H3-like centromeric protein A n=1 Tax=Apis dorsata TaxID=7462 RepID=UPI0002063AF1|nr:histone H3-like centromeric protein A [Apis dorsata]XP_043788378.1 histone H3-like centromeric protein A [Apis laboriosa]
MVRRKSNPRSIDDPQRSPSVKSRPNISANRRVLRTTRALKEIRYLRKTVKLIIPKAPFARLVRYIIIDLFPNSDVDRIQASALEALQEAVEAYIVQFFEDCTLLSQHAKRVTLQIQDVILLRRLRGRDDIINR